MLRDFIILNRDQIIERTRLRVRERLPGQGIDANIEHGIPLFLSQLVDALKESKPLTAPSPGRAEQAQKRIVTSAGIQGYDLLRSGMTVDQVVRGYGDVCQVVTQLAAEAGVVISADDFQVFNACLDDAIAGAVTAYGNQRELDLVGASTERLGVLMHELRNLLHTAILSFDAIKQGMVGVGGSTSALHTRSLSALSSLLERSFLQVREEAGGAPVLEPISVIAFIEEVAANAALKAAERGLRLAVESLETDVTIDADRELLTSAVGNLLQNAIKFTRPGTSIKLTARTSAGRVLIEVADECGGLPPEEAEKLFRPFVQGSSDRSGLGLGLTIARSAVKANLGELHVRDIPGYGCVFTIDLPVLAT